MAEALSSPPGLEHAFEVIEIAEEVTRRPKRSRKRALRKGRWSDFGNEIWERVLHNLDGISLFAMMLLNKRFSLLVQHDKDSWKFAGLRCLPHAWASLLSPGSRFSVNSIEARLFLKYSLIHERTCFRALDAQDFSPYILRSSGVSLITLSRFLPDAQPFVTTAHSPTDINVASEMHQEASTMSSTVSRSQASSPASTASQSVANFPNPLNTTPMTEAGRNMSMRGSVSMPDLPLPPSGALNQLDYPQGQATIAEEVASSYVASELPIETEEATEEEDENFEEAGTEDTVAIPDLATTKKHSTLHRSFSKFKQVVGMIHKSTKATTLPLPVSSKTKSSGQLLPPKASKKRSVKFEERVQGVTGGVDEAWFHLAEPSSKLAKIGRSSTTRWRVMTEANLIVSVMAVYAFNPKVITMGAYMVRRMCFSGANPPTDEIASLRMRLASTPIVTVLLDALENFRKDQEVVTAVLVALGNLALTNVAACAIGDHGLGRIVRAMKRHKDVPKVVDCGIILLLNVTDTRVEYKKKLRELSVPHFLVKELAKFVHSLHQATRTPTDDMRSGSSSASNTPSDRQTPTKRYSKKSSSKSSRTASNISENLKPVIRAHKLLQLGEALPCPIHEAGSGVSSPLPSSTTASTPSSTSIIEKSDAKDVLTRRPRKDSNRPSKSQRNHGNVEQVEQIDMDEQSSSSSFSSSSASPSSPSPWSGDASRNSQATSPTNLASLDTSSSSPVAFTPVNSQRSRVGSNGPAVMPTGRSGRDNDNGFGEPTQFAMDGFDNDPDLDFDQDEDTNDEASRRPRSVDKKDSKSSAWTLRRRPPFSFLASQVAERGAEFATMRRVIDLITVLGADYDILRLDVTLKCSSLLGDAIIILFGLPLPHVDLLLSSAFRCLLVIYEWDIQHQDWTYSSQLVRSLLMLSDALVSAHIFLPYLSNCFLVCFSLVWKRMDQYEERRLLVDLLIASMRMIAPKPSDEDLGSHRTSSSASLTNSHARNALIITGAAMLGDLAHSYYDLRTHIRDSGVIQVIRSLRDQVVDPKHLDRLNDILDEFEDNPLLRGRHHPQPQQPQQDGQPNQPQQAAPLGQQAAAPQV